MGDIIIELEHFPNINILYCNISVDNIIYILKKDKSIILEGDININTKGPTLLADRNNTINETFLNHYKLIIYRSEVLGITSLIDT